MKSKIHNFLTKAIINIIVNRVLPFLKAINLIPNNLRNLKIYLNQIKMIFLKKDAEIAAVINLKIIACILKKTKLKN